MTKYQPGQTVGLDLTSETAAGFDPTAFAALVNIVSSRYGKLEYPPDMNIAPKIAVVWTFEFTSGKTSEKKYSTGIPWGTGLAEVSADGRKLISRSPDFTGIRGQSDAIYLLQKAVASGFPAEAITNDIGVFDGHCFFVVEEVNPRSKGSSKKSYPKTYHPEGFAAAKAAFAAKKAAKAAAQAQQSGTTYQTAPAALQSTYTVPQVTISGDVLTAAGGALMELLAGNGGTITRVQIPAALNQIAGSKGWPPKLRQDVTLALWDLPQLSTIVNNNPALKMDGEKVSFK